MSREGANAQVQALRGSAIILLQEAARSNDFELRDALTRKALAQLAEARRLLVESRAYSIRTATRLH